MFPTRVTPHACMLTWVHAFPSVTVSSLGLFFRLKCVNLQKVGRRSFSHLHFWFLPLQHLWFDFDSFWNFPLVMETFIRRIFDCWGPRVGHRIQDCSTSDRVRNCFRLTEKGNSKKTQGYFTLKFLFIICLEKKNERSSKRKKENSPNKTELNTVSLSYLWWMIMIRQAL